MELLLQSAYEIIKNIEVMRTNHELKINFEVVNIDKPAVKITGIHSYSINNISNKEELKYHLIIVTARDLYRIYPEPFRAF